MLLVISRFDYDADREEELIDWLDRVERCNHALIAPPLRVRGEEGALYTLARYRDLAERNAWVADQRRHELVAQLGSIAGAAKQVYEAELIEEEMI